MANKLYYHVAVAIVVHTDEDPEIVEAGLSERLCELPDIEGGIVEVTDLVIQLVGAKRDV